LPNEAIRPPSVWHFKVALLVGSLILAMVLAEVGTRLFFADKLPVVESERSLLYNYHPTLGWFPAANTTRRFTGSRTVTVTHNSQGFRSPEPVTNGKPTVIVLGDSFVWGFDVEAPERFTDKLQGRHPEWNIYNLGVSGYGTDQELLLLNDCFPVYQPAAVVVVFSSDNDFDDNGRKVTRSGDYKPYFTVRGPSQIQLQGVPVRKSEHVILAEHRILSHSILFRLLVHAFNRPPDSTSVPGENPTLLIIRAIRDYVEGEGAFFGVAIQDGAPVQGLKDFCTHYTIPWVSLATTNRYPTFGAHWTPKGHDDVCDAIEPFLLKVRQKH
jgi:hypothetical protein